MNSRVWKPKHPRVCFSDPMLFTFSVEVTNLGSFKDLPRHEQGVMLLSRDFHFAFPATTVHRQLPLLRSFSAFVPEPKNRTRPARPLPGPKSRDLPQLAGSDCVVAKLKLGSNVGKSPYHELRTERSTEELWAVDRQLGNRQLGSVVSK